MALAEINEFLKIVPAVKKAPFNIFGQRTIPRLTPSTINFKKPSHASDSEITDDDIVIRYENGEVIGLDPNSNSPFLTRSQRRHEYLADQRNAFEIGTIEIRDGKVILRSGTD